MKVLITDAEYKNSLAALRALGKKGINVDVAGNKKLSQSFYSKYTNNKFIYPRPKNKGKKFVKFLIDLLKNENYDVVLPIGAKTTIPISYYKDRIEEYTNLVVPGYKILSKAHDKSKCLKIAKKIGIPIPETHRPESIDEVKNIAGDITYPSVIKIKRGSAAKGLNYANSKKELIENYRQYLNDDREDEIIFNYNRPMIQEFIPGEIHDVCVIFDEEKPKAVLSQKRIRTLPPSGGGGIYNVTTDNEKLKKLSVKLLKKINWHGPAQVEFKIDSRRGEPKLMEVNSKFWGTLDLSIQAGINFPYLACQIALGRKIKKQHEYKRDLYYRWPYPYELKYILEHKNKGEAIKNLLDNRGEVKTDLSIKDPLPHFAEIVRTTPNLVHKFIDSR